MKTKTTTVRGRLRYAEMMEEDHCIVRESDKKALDLSDLLPDEEGLGEWVIVATFTPAKEL